MPTAPAGSLLSLPPPALGTDALSHLLAAHWGISGELTPLTSERDQNHRVDSPAGRFTLKLANPAEDPALTAAQTAALVHLAAAAPDLPLPRVVPARDGRRIVPTPDGALRLLTWCPGTPLAHLPPTPELAAAIGTALGRLDRALAGWSDPATDHVLLWDIRNAAALRPLVPALPDTLRPRIEAFLTRFEAQVAPSLTRLPRQVIHGDFNPHNLLARAGEHTLSGILDFGDMTLSHRVCDLAVAGSYLVAHEDPLRLLGPMVAAWGVECAPSEAEIALLPDLLVARIATTLTISAWRAARYPRNAAYILRNAPTAQAGLAALDAADPARLADALLRAVQGAGA